MEPARRIWLVSVARTSVRAQCAPSRNISPLHRRAGKLRFPVGFFQKLHRRLGRSLATQNCHGFQAVVSDWKTPTEPGLPPIRPRKARVVHGAFCALCGFPSAAFAFPAFRYTDSASTCGLRTRSHLIYLPAGLLLLTRSAFGIAFAGN